MKLKKITAVFMTAIMTAASLNTVFALSATESFEAVGGKYHYSLGAQTIEDDGRTINLKARSIVAGEGGIISVDITPYAKNGATPFGDDDVTYQMAYGGWVVPVRYIEYRAFRWCHNLAVATLPETLFGVEELAFADCESLGTVDMSKCVSLDAIGKSAFMNDTSLSKVTFPETSVLQVIGENAFSNCKSLKSISIPSSVISLGASSFSDSGLKDITLPEGLLVIGKEAFKGSASLESVTIPESVASIGLDAFAETGLKTVYCVKDSTADNPDLYPAGVTFVYDGKPVPSQIISGDVDGDGKITAADATLVLQKALKSTFEMPVDGAFEVFKK